MKRLRDRAPRLWGWQLGAIGLVALVGVLSPQNLPVLAYKLALVCLAGVAGYWLDRNIFPYARPDRLQHPIHVAAAYIRRAIIVAAAMVGVTMGL
jgi:hypothetical protein